MVGVLLLSFIGIPLTAGFNGKFLIFFGAMTVQTPEDRWLYPTLALIGMLNAAVGAWYYLRILSVMYLRDAVKPIETRGPMTGLAALAICAALTLLLSVPPGSSWILTRRAANDIAARAESASGDECGSAVNLTIGNLQFQVAFLARCT